MRNCFLALGIFILWISSGGVLCTADETNPGEGWTYSDWLGLAFTAEYPWIWKAELGWIYDQPVGTEAEHWLYLEGNGWVYTSELIYPSLFWQDSGSWLFYDENAASGGRFFDFAMRRYWERGATPNWRLTRAHACLWQAESLMEETLMNLPNQMAYPIQTDPDGEVWKTVSASSWTSGFWPGMLWMMYEFTGDSQWHSRAFLWNLGISGQKDRTNNHDLGFMLYNSFGHGYRLEGFATYRDILLEAAASLASRYSEKVGATRSWSWGRWDDDGAFTVILDNMMNLELLFWAGKQKEGDSAFLEMAIQHADTTAENFLREDGSAYHVIVFDENTGEVRERSTEQGWSTESAWARGQAWGIYGFTMAYRESGLHRFLESAEAIADFFIDNLASDGVPYWDFMAPSIPNEVKDTSAGAIAASALLELSTLVDNEEKGTTYFNQAERIIFSLLDPTYFGAENSGALLSHGTYNWPSENRDTAVIWGDYYLLEALLRYIALLEGASAVVGE